MGFRDYVVKEVLILKAMSASELKVQIIDIIKSRRVIDLQYSTTNQSDDSIEYSALLLVE